MAYCNRCMAKEMEESILSEIAHAKNRSLQSLLRQMQYGKSSLQDRAERKRKERLREKGEKREEYERKLKQYEEELSYQVMEKIFKEDVDESVPRRL